jgi:general L-amino acid transport system substrate-binding protein
VLGDAGKVKFVPTSAQTRITALQSGEIDILSRNTTWTYSRDASLGLVWIGVNFHDGQAFMVRKGPGMDSVKRLNGATICLDSGSTTEKNTTDYFRANRMTFKPVVFDNADATQQAFESGRCQAISKDYSALAVMRAAEVKDPDAYVILPEVISKEPLGPAIKRGDDEWFAITRWVLNAMIEAEELGIFQHNIDQLRGGSADPAIKRFLGAGEDLGKPLGLDKDWAYRVVKQVGNYAESFDSNLGRASRLRLPRGNMKLWKHGGLMFSPPLR